MGFNTRTALGAVAAFYASLASAATSSVCRNDNLCFQWGVPEAAASSGSGNVYLQLRAPTSYAWVALGTGSRMAGSEIFLVYQDGNGNVTLSTREGQGHVMPEYVDKSGVELLAGSGVSNNEMIANIRCSSCSSLDLSDSTSSWIAAWNTNGPLTSSDTSYGISEHTTHTNFRVDLTKATISSDANPFVGSQDGGNNTGDNGSGSDTGSGSGSGSGSGVSEGGSSDNTNTLIRAHGIVMAIVFVAAYPIGALLMPLVRKWYIHAAWQTIAFLGMWAGFAIGYVASDRLGIFFSQTHTRMGTIVVALMGVQPILGWMHHSHYQKNQSRGAVSHIHIWYGRALMIVGIVNGGLGLDLAGSSRGFIIAYSVVAGICGLLYIGGSALRRNKPTARLTKESSETRS